MEGLQIVQQVMGVQVVDYRVYLHLVHLLLQMHWLLQEAVVAVVELEGQQVIMVVQH